MRYPPIGPSVSTNIPLDIALWVQREARRKRCARAVVLRELIMVGFSAQKVRV